MNRRHYLLGLGTGVGTLPIVSGTGGVSSRIAVDIVETNAPVEGGDLLDVTGELANTGSTDERVELAFVVGENSSVVSRRIVPVEAGSERTVDFLQFRTYPVRADDTFPVRLETQYDVAETTVEVTGVEEIDSRYAYPDRDRGPTVRPGTSILFEIDADPLDRQGNVHWYVDGEYVATPLGPWPSMYFGEVGREYYSHAFDESGTYLVDAAVETDDGNTASRWKVSVADDGAAAPTVDASRPERDELPVDESTALELDVSSADAELDRVVWWLTQSDAILGVTDLAGFSGTASIEVDGGCHTCRIEAWVIDEHNAYTVVSPWQFEGFDERADEGGENDDTTGSDDEKTENGGDGTDDDADDDDNATEGDDDETDGKAGGEVTVSIVETNSPVTGGEYLYVVAEIENVGGAKVTRTVDFVVGHDPETVDSRTVTIDAGATKRIELGYETYPVKYDDSYPVRVVTDDDAAERTVLAHGTES